MHGRVVWGQKNPAQTALQLPVIDYFGQYSFEILSGIQSPKKIRIFMCDLFLVVALHQVCLFCIFMRKNSRKINMVIGQTPVPATPINVNIFFVLKKSLLFCNLQFTPAKHQNLEQQNFWQLAIKQNRFFFFVCVQLSIIIAVPPTSLSLQYFTQPATVCIRQKWSTFLPYLV